MNIALPSKYIELIISGLPTKEIPDPDSFTGEFFIKYLKKK